MSWPAHLPFPERWPPAIEDIGDHARALNEFRCLNDRARVLARARIMAAAMGRDFDAELAARR